MWPRETTPAEEPAPDDLEAALLSALTHQLAGLEGVRIRGVLFDGHHPNTTVLITCDKLSPQPVSQEVRVSLWGDDKKASLAKRSPMEVGAAIVARLRDAVA